MVQVRQQFPVRPANVSDFPAITQMCVSAREESLVGSQLCSPDEAALTRQLSVLASLPGGQLQVLEAEGQIQGFTLLRLLDQDLLHGQPTLYIEALYIAPTFRRKGAGHALMAAAAKIAADSGAVDVYSQPLPGSRGTQRFLARLGFAPAAAHRVVSTAALQRALTSDSGLRRSPARTLEDLIAKRRRSRVETHSGPVDLRSFQEQVQRGERGRAVPASRHHTAAVRRTHRAS